MRMQIPTQFDERLKFAEVLAYSHWAVRLEPRGINGAPLLAGEERKLALVGNVMMCMNYAEMFNAELGEVMNNMIVFNDGRIGWNKRFTEGVLRHSKWLDGPIEYEVMGEQADNSLSVLARGRKGTKILRSRTCTLAEVVKPEAGAGREAWCENPRALLEGRALNDFVSRYAAHLFLGFPEQHAEGALVTEIKPGDKLPRAEPPTAADGPMTSDQSIVALARKPTFGQVDKPAPVAPAPVQAAESAAEAPEKAPEKAPAPKVKQRRRTKLELEEIAKQVAEKAGETPPAQPEPDAVAAPAKPAASRSERLLDRLDIPAPDSRTSSDESEIDRLFPKSLPPPALDL